MKRGFWALIAAVLLVLVLGFLLWPKPMSAEAKQAYDSCLSENEYYADLLSAIKTRDMAYCDAISSSHDFEILKNVCVATVNNDAAICETMPLDAKEECLAIVSKDALQCGDQLENWWCVAIANQNPEFCKQEQLVANNYVEECTAAASLDAGFYRAAARQADCRSEALNLQKQ